MQYGVGLRDVGESIGLLCSGILTFITVIRRKFRYPNKLKCTSQPREK